MSLNMQKQRQYFPFLYPLGFVLFLCTFSFISAFSGMQTGGSFADFFDLFFGWMSILSNALFPAGFTIAMSLAFQQKDSIDRIHSRPAPVLQSVVIGMLSMAAGFLLFMAFGSLSLSVQHEVGNAELGAVAFFILPVLSGIFGIFVAALMRQLSVGRSMKGNILIFVLLLACIAMVIARNSLQRAKALQKHEQTLEYMHSKNPDDCLKIDENIRGGCWQPKSLILQDVSLCDHMLGDVAKNYCRDEFYKQSAKDADCELMSNTQGRDYCYYLHALSTRNKNLCLQIRPDSTYKSDCFQRF
jgi:hypothetical protein